MDIFRKYYIYAIADEKKDLCPLKPLAYFYAVDKVHAYVLLKDWFKNFAPAGSTVCDYSFERVTYSPFLQPELEDDYVTEADFSFFGRLCQEAN